LRAWVRFRDPHRIQEKAEALDEVETAIEAAGLAPAPGITDSR
jgi:hypothetical protein